MQTTLRLPDVLHAEIQAQADRDRRSVNAEMVWLLERGLGAASTILPLMDMTGFESSAGLPHGWVWWRCTYCDRGRIFRGTVREESAEAHAHLDTCLMNPRPSA